MADTMVPDTASPHANSDTARTRGSLDADIIIANAPDPLFVADLEGKIIQANDAVSELLGFRPDEVLEQSLSRFITPEEIREFLAALREVVEHGVTRNARLNPRSASGEYIPTTLNASALRDADGRVIGAIGILRDMRAYEQVVRDLEQSKAELQEMRQLSRQVEEQRQVLERHASSLERMVEERTRELLEANLAKDELLRARDQALALAKAAMREQETARKEVEVLAKELKEQAGELNAIFEAIADGVYVCNAEGQIVRVNARWAELVGRPAEELLQPGTRHGELAGFRRLNGAPLDADEYPLAQALRGTTVTNMRLMIRQHSTGKDIPIRVSSSPIRDEADAITGAVAVASDISELYQLERHKDEFLSIVSHELKTPLASLKVMAQLTHRRLQRADIPMPAQLTNMERSIGRMETLVNDLVDISRIESGKLALRLERASLITLCKQAVEEQIAATNRVIVFEAPGDPFEVEVDGDRIGQVLVNLLSNALKYSAAHAPVTLTLERAGDMAIVRVHDEGPGIPPEALPRIFERFYRVPSIEVQVGSGVGLGLGLYISHEIVERHGGRIWVESETGAGSTFCVALRLARARSGSVVAHSYEASTPR